MNASINPIIKTLKDYFKHKTIKALEIGARYGDSSITILKNLNIEKYIIVDPYISYDEYDDGFNQIIKNNGDIIMNSTLDRLKDYPIELLRDFSNNIHNKIEDNSLDLIFIDGNHSYNYVYDDIKFYFPKVKKGGIICGDDYFMRNKKNDWNNSGNQYDEDMVYEAVQDYFNETGYTIEEFGLHSKYPKTWLVKK